MSALYIITGEEEFLIERKIQQIISDNLCEQTYKFVFPDQKNLYSDISQSPDLIGSPRVYHVVSNEVPDLPIGDQDILIVQSGSKKVSNKLAEACFHYPKLRSYKNKNEVLDFIVKEGESRRISLKRVATALFVNVGSSLRKLSSEIDKLSQIVPEGGSVDPDLFKSVVCFAATLTPRAIVDAVCEGNALKALVFYKKLQDNADETGWIIAYLMRHTANQLRVDSLHNSGMLYGDIPSELNMNSFVFSNGHGKMIGRWSFDSLRDHMSGLCKIDALHKRGTDVKSLLEKTIIEMATEAGDDDR